MRFIGHLDLVRVWERAVRRAAVPVAFTAGFSPRPRMHFGLALPTTFASSAEYLDLDLTHEVDAARTARDLTQVLPEGIDVTAAAPADPESESLQASVAASEYLVVAAVAPDEGRRRLDGVLAAERLEFELERKGRTRLVDLRPGVLVARLAEPAEAAPVAGYRPDACIMLMRLAAQPRSLRPTEVCAVMSPPVDMHLAHRSAQLVGGPSEFSEPLPAGLPVEEPVPRPRPIDERSGDGTLREEAPSDPPTPTLAPRP